MNQENDNTRTPGIEILTDIESLHQKSTPLDKEDHQEKLFTLISSIPHNALGLAAPQIGIFERFFYANLSKGKYIFINPVVDAGDMPKSMPSTEACLSLPDVVRTVYRHGQVTLRYEAAYSLDKNGVYLVLNPVENKEMLLTYQDACIVQHEADHLDGVLIIDLPECEENNELEEKQNKRHQKIQARRILKKNIEKAQSQTKESKPKKVSAKKSSKIKKQKEKERRAERTRRRQEKKRVEIEERYKMSKEGLI